MQRERQSTLLDLGLFICCCVVVYTSLTPWAGWRVPSHSVWRFLSDPWPRYWSWFDVLTNLVAYVPIGILLAARWRTRLRGVVILALVVLAGALLSLMLEGLQNFLPKRVPSRLDLILNASGALLGALGALMLMQRSHVEREIIWHRPRWLGGESVPFLAVVMVWLIAQLAAQRLLFETGSVLSPALQLLSNHAGQASSHLRPDVEFAATLAFWLEQTKLSHSYSIFLEAMSVAISIACIGLLLIDALATQRVRVTVMILILLAGFVLRATVLTAMSQSATFGFWLSAGTQAGLLFGPILLFLLLHLGRRHRLVWLLALLFVNLLLVNLLPDNVYQAQMVPAAAEGSLARNALMTVRVIAALWPVLAILVVARQLVLHKRRWEGIPFMDEQAVTHYPRMSPSPRHA